MIVVDSNVISYFLIASEHTLSAEKVLRKDPDWAVPKLWSSEVRNVLWLYLRKKELDLSGALAKIQLAKQIVGGKEYEVESERVLQLAVASNCTAYDCEFVYLAEKLNVPLVTSDKKLLAAFPDIARSMDAFAA